MYVSISVPNSSSKFLKTDVNIHMAIISMWSATTYSPTHHSANQLRHQHQREKAYSTYLRWVKSTDTLTRYLLLRSLITLLTLAGERSNLLVLTRDSLDLLGLLFAISFFSNQKKSNIYIYLYICKYVIIITVQNSRKHRKMFCMYICIYLSN